MVMAAIPAVVMANFVFSFMLQWVHLARSDDDRVAGANPDRREYISRR
jgi:hypothetical protein